MNDPALREPTALVTIDELDYIKSLVSEMTKVMLDENGVGLAANQVGISKRFFIMKDGDRVILVINPEIIQVGPLSPFTEGCLSIPGVQAETQRAQEIKFKFKDEDFKDVEAIYSGPPAVAVQHEIDHLDGKLYIDQLPPVRRMLTIDKHKKYIKMRGR